VCVGINSKAKPEGSWLCESSRLVLESVIPPTYRLGSVVETHESGAGESPSLVFLLPSYSLEKDGSVGKKFDRGVQRIVEVTTMGNGMEGSVLVRGARL